MIAPQWVSSDGELMRSITQPDKNWSMLPNQRPGEYTDEDSYLLHIVPDRLGIAMFIELRWEDGIGWMRTNTPPLTRWDIEDRIRKDSDEQIFSVEVGEQGHIVREGRVK